MKRSEVKGGPSSAAKVSRTEETESGSGDAKTVENTVATKVEYTFDICEAYFHVKFENIPCLPVEKPNEKKIKEAREKHPDDPRLQNLYEHWARLPGITILDHTFKAKTDLGDEVQIQLRVKGDSVASVSTNGFKECQQFELGFGIDPNPRHRQEFDFGYWFSDKDRSSRTEEGYGITFLNVDEAWPPEPEDRSLSNDEELQQTMNIRWASGEIGVSYTHGTFLGSSALRKMFSDFCPLKPPNEPTDFKIEAPSKTANKGFDFHKAYLSNISPVFRAKLYDPTSVESKNGTMKLDDFDADTVRILQDLMYKVNSAGFNETSKKFNVEFLKLARKFEIEPFFNACQQKLIDLMEKKYLRSDEKRPNVIEVLKVADSISDEKLFNAAINYVKLMGKKSGKKAESELEEFMKSSEWEKFTKENPELSGKVLNLIKPEK